jgi:hypothetical protein
MNHLSLKEVPVYALAAAWKYAEFVGFADVHNGILHLLVSVITHDLGCQPPSGTPAVAALGRLGPCRLSKRSQLLRCPSGYPEK